MLDQRDAVVCHRTDGCRRGLRRRSPCAAIVDSDDAVVRGEIGNDRLPAQRIGRQAGNEKKRCSLAAAFVIELHVTAREHCHRTLVSRFRCPYGSVTFSTTTSHEPEMPRNISYRRPIEAIRTARTKPVVIKRSRTLSVRTKVPKRKRTG